MRHGLGARNDFFAIWALEVFDWGLVCLAIEKLFLPAKYVLILGTLNRSLLLNLFRIYFLQFGCVATDSSPLFLSLLKIKHE